ncbi:MAG TPA: glycosyltransferase [Methylococcales bacterium]
MNILLVAESLTPSRNTGVTAVVTALAHALQKEGIHTELCAPILPGDQKETHTALQGLKAHLFPQPAVLPRTLAPSLGRFIERELRRFDLVHIHGLWRYPQWAAAHAAQRQGIPYVISPHGMCEPFELARKGWRKQLHWNLLERHNLEQASAIHAITEAERRHCERLTKTSVRVISNGVSVTLPEENTLELKAHLPLALPSNAPVLLFLGRLHPKKGLDLLLEAASNLPEAHLVLAGPDPIGYRATLIEQVHRHRLQERVHFPGMVTGLAKQALLARADAFVLPSYSEGFSMAVLEALAAAKPVVITRRCYFDRVAEEGCGWVVEPTLADLTQALKALLYLAPEELKKMGLRGRSLVESEYTWSAVACQMHEFYRTLL